jgi:hypothetical protein
MPASTTSPSRCRDAKVWRHRGDWLDSLGIAHSGIQSKKEPFVYSTIVFCDLDKIQLEVVAIDV